MQTTIVEIGCVLTGRASAIAVHSRLQCDPRSSLVQEELSLLNIELCRVEVLQEMSLLSDTDNNLSMSVANTSTFRGGTLTGHDAPIMRGLQWHKRLYSRKMMSN